MNSTRLVLKLVFVFLNMCVSKELVLTVPQGTTMTASVIDVFANLATSRKADSATLSAPATKTTSTVNVNAATE